MFLFLVKIFIEFLGKHSTLFEQH